MTTFKACIVTAEACGYGQFPIDMLRYDQCFPTTESDSATIAREHEHRTVKLTRITALPPRGPAGAPPRALFTPERWKSFGWELLNEAVQS